LVKRLKLLPADVNKLVVNVETVVKIVPAKELNNHTSPKLCNYHGTYLSTWDGPGDFELVGTDICEHCTENNVLIPVIMKVLDEQND
jgi:hypothetical protein